MAIQNSEEKLPVALSIEHSVLALLLEVVTRVLARNGAGRTANAIAEKLVGV
jgi:hypothetical protein